MDNVKDTVQVAVANSTAIGFSLTECNDILTFVSLLLAISFTIFKFFKFNKNA